MIGCMFCIEGQGRKGEGYIIYVYVLGQIFMLVSIIKKKYGFSKLKLLYITLIKRRRKSPFIWKQLRI